MALTREILTRFLRDRAMVDDVAGDTALFSSGALDSVSQLDLIALIESEAGIRVDYADVTLANLDSVDQILAFVESRMRKTG